MDVIIVIIQIPSYICIYLILYNIFGNKISFIINANFYFDTATVRIDMVEMIYMVTYVYELLKCGENSTIN